LTYYNYKVKTKVRIITVNCSQKQTKVINTG